LQSKHSLAGKWWNSSLSEINVVGAAAGTNACDPLTHRPQLFYACGPSITRNHHQIILPKHGFGCSLNTKTTLLDDADTSRCWSNHFRHRRELGKPPAVSIKGALVRSSCCRLCNLLHSADLCPTFALIVVLGPFS